MNSSPYSKAALKRGAWQFLSGKAATALLTFLILLAVVRLLPISDYAAYVTFTAAVELAYSTLATGLPWLASRYLPEFRLHASGTQLRKFILRLLLAQGVVLVTAAGILLAGLNTYLDWAGLVAYRYAALLFVLMFVIEYGCRFIRERLLSPLMQQSWVRSSQVGRQITFALLLSAYSLAGEVRVVEVIYAEIAAAVVGLVVAGLGLSRHLHSLLARPQQSDWIAPKGREMWRVGNDMYFAQLLTIAYSPQALVLLMQRMLSVEALALFGFLRILYLQVANNLPATLLFTLVQPKLVASRVGGGIAELSRNANLAGKLSLFALMPLLATAAAVGEELVAIASGSKFQESGALFFGLLLALVPFSQRLLLETVAMAAGYSAICTLAALSGFVVLPLLWWLIDLGWGLWAPITTLCAGYWLFNVIVQGALVRRTEYRPDVLGTFKLLAAAGLGALAALPLAARLPALPGLLVSALTAGLVYLAVAWLLKPFTESERSRLNALFGRRLFVW